MPSVTKAYSNLSIARSQDDPFDRTKKCRFYLQRSMPSDVVEGTFSLVLTEVTGLAKLQVKKGSYRIKMK